jgi:hypothetical protein
LKEQIAQHRYPASGRAGASIQQRRASLPARQTRQPVPQVDDGEDDDDIYPKRPPTSAIRYTRQPEVYTQGNRRLVVHREPPPKKRRFHWLFFVGLAMFIMIFGWIIFSALANWWQVKQNDWTYGNPRTFQTDQAVGINDSSQTPSHFIAINLHGDVFVIDLEGGNPTKAQSIPIIGLSSDRDGDPVTISFQDVNGDGKLDMLVHVAGFTIILLNNGKTFIAQHQ